MYFDGSAVGLSGASENIDAVSVLDDGRIIISTNGAASGLAGLSSGGQPQDLLAFNPNNNQWSMYFRGSNVGLSTSENVNALFITDRSSNVSPLLLSTSGKFDVPGVKGGREDVFQFNPTNLGVNTSGSYTPGLVLDGSKVGLKAGSKTYNITGVWVGDAPGGFGGFSRARTASFAMADTIGDEALWMDDQFDGGSTDDLATTPGDDSAAFEQKRNRRKDSGDASRPSSAAAKLRNATDEFFSLTSRSAKRNRGADALEAGLGLNLG
jgi:hypothetical protein